MKKKADSKHYAHSIGSLWKAVSLLAAPQITPFYFFLLLVAGNGYRKPWELGVSFIFATAIQMASLVIYAKVIKSDVFLNEREKRAVAFVVGIASYLIGFVILAIGNADFVVSALMLAYFINTIAAAIINQYVDKVSIHTWGISGPSVALLYQFGLAGFVPAVVLALLVGASRVHVKAHTWRQVAIAIVTSVPLTILVIYYIAPLAV
jgi:membrane-associated phospholipid phosphatase